MVISSAEKKAIKIWFTKLPNNNVVIQWQITVITLNGEKSKTIKQFKVTITKVLPSVVCASGARNQKHERTNLKKYQNT